MLYLITTEQRKKIIDEYESRIWLVSCVGLVILVAIFFILSIPTILAMQAESKSLNEKVAPLEDEEKNMKEQSAKEGAVIITKNLALLQLSKEKNVRDIYKEVIEMFEGVSGVVIQNITVDTLSKTVDVTSLVRDKDVAKLLVDRIQASSYKGGSLSYDVLSQRASFVFNQKLTYTE